MVAINQKCQPCLRLNVGHIAHPVSCSGRFCCVYICCKSVLSISTTFSFVFGESFSFHCFQQTSVIFTETKKGKHRQEKFALLECLRSPHTASILFTIYFSLCQTKKKFIWRLDATIFFSLLWAKVKFLTPRRNGNRSHLRKAWCPKAATEIHLQSRWKLDGNFHLAKPPVMLGLKACEIRPLRQKCRCQLNRLKSQVFEADFIIAEPYQARICWN